jgi:hypothetical protein
MASKWPHVYGFMCLLGSLLSSLGNESELTRVVFLGSAAICFSIGATNDGATKNV